jgi:hypothetical protein
VVGPLLSFYNGKEFTATKKKNKKPIQKKTWIEVDFGTKLCRFSLYEADFGWGKPTWFGSLALIFKNLAFFVDAPLGDVIEAYVSLKKECMTKFESDTQIAIDTVDTQIWVNIANTQIAINSIFSLSNTMVLGGRKAFSISSSHVFLWIGFLFSFFVVMKSFPLRKKSNLRVVRPPRKPKPFFFPLFFSLLKVTEPSETDLR